MQQRSKLVKGKTTEGGVKSIGKHLFLLWHILKKSIFLKQYTDRIIQLGDRAYRM